MRRGSWLSDKVKMLEFMIEGSEREEISGGNGRPEPNCSGPLAVGKRAQNRPESFAPKCTRRRERREKRANPFFFFFFFPRATTIAASSSFCHSLRHSPRHPHPQSPSLHLHKHAGCMWSSATDKRSRYVLPGPSQKPRLTISRLLGRARKNVPAPFVQIGRAHV